MKILEEGEKKGKIRGELIGELIDEFIGAHKKSVTLLTRLLEKKLGAIPEPIKQAIASSKVTVLDSLIVDMLIIESYEEVEERLGDH